MEYNGKDKKKLMQTKHNRGQKDGQAQSKALFLFLFISISFLFVTQLIIRRTRKEVAGIVGGGEREEENKREREEGKICNFFCFFKVLCGIIISKKF